MASALGAAVTSLVAGGQAETEQVFADVVSFLADTGYPTGGTLLFRDYLRAKIGEPFAARTLISATGHGVLAGVLYTFIWDPVNDTLLAYLGSTGAEVADTTALNAMTITMTVFSK